VDWTTDIDEARWVEEALSTFAADVRSVVPAGYEAYARVFHPVDDGPHRRWSDVARANGRIPHPEMQWPHISGGASGPREGDLPLPEGLVLRDLLSPHTSTPDDAWFGVWDGYGQFHDGASAHLTSDGKGGEIPGCLPDRLRPEHRLQMPGRQYYLARGSLAELPTAYELFGGGWNQSPNLWWPADRAWFVATEIDFVSTYLGATEAAIETILASPSIEAMPAQPTHGVTYDADVLNQALR
jgi:hypothetical protein